MYDTRAKKWYWLDSHSSFLLFLFVTEMAVEWLRRLRLHFTSESQSQSQSTQEIIFVLDLDPTTRFFRSEKWRNLNLTVFWRNFVWNTLGMEVEKRSSFYRMYHWCFWLYSSLTTLLTLCCGAGAGPLLPFLASFTLPHLLQLQFQSNLLFPTFSAFSGSHLSIRFSSQVKWAEWSRSELSRAAFQFLSLAFNTWLELKERHWFSSHSFPNYDFIHLS